MVKKWDVTIPTLSGKKTRKAYIYLPDYYDEDQFRRYPVLYMFDGHKILGHGKLHGMGPQASDHRGCGVQQKRQRPYA